MNKLERAYEDQLVLQKVRRLVVTWFFESLKFRLATKTWYTPDFVVQLADGTLRVVEVKGHWRDDARVKIKVAAEMYPQFVFAAVRRVNGRWVEEEIPSRPNRLDRSGAST